MPTKTIIYHRKEIEIKVPMNRLTMLYPKMIVHQFQEIYPTFFNDIYIYIYIKYILFLFYRQLV